MSKLAAARPIVLSLCIAAAPVAAIVERADRTDADYLALAAQAPAVAHIFPDGAGVLIAPRWVLTAAHVVDATSVFSAVEIAGERIPVAARVAHPSWTGEPNPDSFDLGLLELARPARATPVPLAGGDDGPGVAVRFYGWGDRGTGDVGVTGSDGRLRGADNRVESATPSKLVFRFDAPPAGEPLEGVSGPGDSGGPALLAAGDGWRVAGVSSGSRGEPGRYGVEEVYTRVSTARDWIEKTIAAGDGAASPFAPARRLAAGGSLDDRGVEAVARDFFAATGRDAEALVAFDHARRSAAALGRRSDEKRLAFYRDLLAEHGALTPVAVGAADGSSLAVLARDSTHGDCFAFQFFFDDPVAAKLEGFTFGAAACE